MKTITIRGEGAVLDALLNAEYGAVLARTLLVPTLELNPGIAALGPVLPIGTEVLIPDRPEPQLFAPRTTVSLFG
ncbi:tail protein X [Roseinatronobacter sp.]